MIYSIILSLCLSLFPIVSFAGSSIGQIKVEILQTNSAHKTPVRLRMNGFEIGSFSHSMRSDVFNVSTNNLNSGTQTSLVSNYGSLQVGCQFQYVLHFSIDGSHWIRLGLYNAPTEQVNTVIPLGLCNGQLCSKDRLISEQLQKQEDARWEKNKEFLRKWLDDTFERERISFEKSKRRALEKAQIKEPKIDLSVELPVFDTKGAGLNDDHRISTEVNIDSMVEDILLDVELENAKRNMEFLKSCESMSSADQHLCSRYGGLGWMGAVAESAEYVRLAEQGLLTEEEIRQKILSKEAQGRHRLASQVEKQAIVISEIEKQKQIAKYVRHLKDIREMAVNGARFAPGVSDGVDIYEALFGLDAGTGASLDGSQRLFAVLGMIGGSRAIWAGLSAEVKLALFSGNAHEAQKLAAIADKMASMSNSFDAKGVGHVLFGETRMVDGVRKIKSGLHSETAVQGMMREWEVQGLKTNVVNVNSLSEFSPELLSGNTILRHQTSNGVLVYQFPRDRFVNIKMADKNVADLNGMMVPGAKTVFPSGWDEHKILNSIEDSLNKGVPNKRGRSHTVDSVYIQVGVDDVTNKVITGFPKVKD